MKKNLIIIIGLILAGILTACSLPFIGSSQSSTTGAVRNSGLADPSTLPVESKIAIGIIKLEGTDQAVGADQAKELLPLFYALKTLSTNTNTAAEEITALNNQIKNTMTDSQVSAIEKLSLTSSELRTMMSEINQETAATSGSTTTNTRSSGGGEFPGGGGPGGIPGVTRGGETTSSSVQATPNAVQAAQTARRTAGGLNLTFAESVIKLLESKISK